MNELTKEEMIKATVDGVAKGVKQHLAGLHSETILAAIQEGIRSSFPSDLDQVISRAIYDSMPYESQILNAISSGCENRTKRPRKSSIA